MIKVKLRNNESTEQMLRRFKKACEKEGLTKDIKRVAYYEKPSEKKRRRIRKGPPRGGSGPVRGDVMKVNASAAAGPVVPAGDLMKHLSSTNPWSKQG